jgi:hypothetical protein
VSINMDIDSAQACDALTTATLTVTSGPDTWVFPPPRDPAVKAMVVAELYRHPITAT